MASGLLVVAAVAVTWTSVWFLLQRAQAPSATTAGGANLPPMSVAAYRFVWKATAPGSLTAQQAYEAEGRVQRSSDGVEMTPVATLWVAQSDDAAFLIVQEDPQGHLLSVVALARSGEGGSAAWQVSVSGWPAVVYCTNDSTRPDGTCSEGSLTSPDDFRLSELWAWSAPGNATGVAARFLEPLTTGPSGGMIAGLTLAVGSARESDGSTVVAVGTASAAAMQQRAEQLAGAG